MGIPEVACVTQQCCLTALQYKASVKIISLSLSHSHKTEIPTSFVQRAYVLPLVFESRIFLYIKIPFFGLFFFGKNIQKQILTKNDLK